MSVQLTMKASLNVGMGTIVQGETPILYGKGGWCQLPYNPQITAVQDTNQLYAQLDFGVNTAHKLGGKLMRAQMDIGVQLV